MYWNGVFRVAGGTTRSLRVTVASTNCAGKLWPVTRQSEKRTWGFATWGFRIQYYAAKTWSRKQSGTIEDLNFSRMESCEYENVAEKVARRESCKQTKSCGWKTASCGWKASSFEGKTAIKTEKLRVDRGTGCNIWFFADVATCRKRSLRKVIACKKQKMQKEYCKPQRKLQKKTACCRNITQIP